MNLQYIQYLNALWTGEICRKQLNSYEFTQVGETQNTEQVEVDNCVYIIILSTFHNFFK